MPPSASTRSNDHTSDRLDRALESNDLAKARTVLAGVPTPVIAHLLESSPPKRRTAIWHCIADDHSGAVLNELGDEVRAQLLASADAEAVRHMVRPLAADDSADILQQLPPQVLGQVLDGMDATERRRIEGVLPYPEDSAGGLMDTDAITVRADTTIAAVLRYLRRHGELPDATDSLFVVDRKHRFLGLLPIRRLLVSQPADTAGSLMLTGIEPIPAAMPDSEVATLFERNDWISAPVVDGAGRLIGRITIDDVVDVIREDADHALMSLAGLEEDADTFSTIRRTVPRRAVWLGINLLAVFVSANVIHLFQATIEKVVALAILMPIVASMGGVAGSQTLTITIRGLALGQVGRANAAWLLGREIAVAGLNGTLWALLAGAAAIVWFGDDTLGLVIAAAMVINLLIAACAGVAIPVVLKRLSIDPALAGGMALNTLTDAVGFFTFLGLATLFYG